MFKKFTSLSFHHFLHFEVKEFIKNFMRQSHVDIPIMLMNNVTQIFSGLLDYRAREFLIFQIRKLDGNLSIFKDFFSKKRKICSLNVFSQVVRRNNAVK